LSMCRLGTLSLIHRSLPERRSAAFCDLPAVPVPSAAALER
jgi:hypothetical protein